MGRLEFADFRKEYINNSLDENKVALDPISQFSIWFKDALAADVDEPNAMFLATVSKEGQPSGRVVLLKGFDEDGFIFFTNYESRKGKEIENNPLVAATFLWKELERQVRVTGRAEVIPSVDSDEYFKSRPFESRVSACISDQSQSIPNREYLEQLRESFIQQHIDQDLIRPENWGGYKIIPDAIEFWQGREFRLHDRILYRRSGNNWLRERLAP